MSWLSWNVSSMRKLDGKYELDMFYCKFDELAKLRMSSMSWIS